MTRSLSTTLLVALFVSASPGLALDVHPPTDVRPATLTQRQVRTCMIKRMTADKLLSYNEARRGCADELKAQSNALAAPPAAVNRQGS